MDYVGQWGEGALFTPGPLNGIVRSECHLGPGVLLVKVKSVFKDNRSIRRHKQVKIFQILYLLLWKDRDPDLYK